MYNQGYRPPNQTPVPQNNQGGWNGPTGYSGYRPPQPQATQAGKPRASKTVVRKERAPGRERSGGSMPVGGGYPPKAPKRRSLKWQLIKALVILVALAGAGVGIYVWKTQADVRPYTNVFLDNVYVDGISLQGMTWEQGVNVVQKQINDKLNGWYVRLRNPAGEYKDITAQMLGINRDPTQAMEAAWTVGHETSATNRKTIFQLRDEINATKNNRLDFSSVEQSGDTTSIDTILSTLANAAYVEPQDAAVLSFDPDNTTQPFTFQNEVMGKKLDIEAIKEQILQMVKTFTTGEVLVQAYGGSTQRDCRKPAGVLRAAFPLCNADRFAFHRGAQQ